MRTLRVMALASAAILGTSVLAGAQEAGKTGVTMAYPGSVGVIWHASDTIAVRPAFSFNHTSDDSSATSNSGGWGAGFDLGVLFYLKKYDNVRTYVSPGFSLTHTSATVTPVAPSDVPAFTSHQNVAGGSGTFGAQYFASPHFSAYGEVGLSFSHRHTDAGTTSVTLSGTSWGTVAGVGVVFYP